MAEIDDLRAELERLRNLLDRYGIDPEPPGPPEPETFGPPTLLMHRMQRLFARSAASFAAEDSRWLCDKAFAAGAQWAAMSVRLPAHVSVVVNRIV